MPEVRIRLAVGTLRMEYSGSRAFFERTIAPLLEAAYASSEAGGHSGAPGSEEAAVSDPLAPIPAPKGPAFRPTSPPRFNQFTGQVGPRAATVDQRAMAFAFYLWNYERKEEFSVEEIEAFFRTVREEPPDDMDARMSDLSDEKRFLEPGREDGAWRLTSKGVNYVKHCLLGGVA